MVPQESGFRTCWNCRTRILEQGFSLGLSTSKAGRGWGGWGGDSHRRPSSLWTAVVRTQCSSLSEHNQSYLQHGPGPGPEEQDCPAAGSRCVEWPSGPGEELMFSKPPRLWSWLSCSREVEAGFAAPCRRLSRSASAPACFPGFLPLSRLQQHLCGLLKTALSQ